MANKNNNTFIAQMKKNGGYFHDITTNTLHITKDFERNANRIGTWQCAVMDSLTLKSSSKPTVEVHTHKRAPRLTYKMMEVFISKMPNAEANFAEYSRIVLKSKVARNPYKEDLNWFEETFPHYGKLTIVKDDIDADVSVRFKYFDYDVKMERVFRRKGGWYEVSPLLLVYSDDNYYLVGCDHKDGKVRNFRVDRMAHLNGTGHPRIGKDLFTKEDLGLYQRYSFNMYNGTVEEVTMRFRNNMMNAVVDKFGRQNFVNRVDEDHFEVTVPVAVSPQFFGWVFGLGNYVTIIGPEWVKEKMVEALEKVRKRY